jgi:2-polyprenyl-3-methyl-5-hydroxy-6-metoxy-1,4-benzoquinol methylase
VSAGENDVKAFLQSLLETAAERAKHNPQTFPVIWDEPDSQIVRYVVETAQANYFPSLSGKKQPYFESSLPRFKFILDRVLKYVPLGSKVLDVGCAPGFLSIFLDTAGYRIHGIDLNENWFSEYPDPYWLRFLNVQAVNVEQSALPFPDGSFDAILFAEVLEHIAICPPGKILAEFRRVLKLHGYLFLTTPNVANVSNILALAAGKNIFWQPEIFYGSTDRHNREYTPDEVVTLVSEKFNVCESFLFNGSNNWNSATIDLIYENFGLLRGQNLALLGNTVFIAAQPRPAARECSVELHEPKGSAIES